MFIVISKDSMPLEPSPAISSLKYPFSKIQNNQFLHMDMDGNKLILPRSSTDRKTTEKNRRNQMKSLYTELNSLVPSFTTKAFAGSLPDKLDEAAKHIKKLQVSLEKLRIKKENLQSPSNKKTNCIDDQVRFLEPDLEVHRIGSALEVILVTGLDLDHQFTLFSKVVRVLHDEGAEVVNASFYMSSDKVFHVIHSKVEESEPGYGAASRLEERLHALLH